MKSPRNDHSGVLGLKEGACLPDAFLSGRCSESPVVWHVFLLLISAFFWFFQPCGQQQLGQVFLFRPILRRFEAQNVGFFASLISFVDMPRGDVYDEQFELRLARAVLWQ